MAEIQKDTYAGLVMRWLTGAIYAPIKIVGARQVKVMTRAMSLAFVDQLAREGEQNGTKVSPTNNVVDALEQYRKLESASNLCEEKDVTISPTDEGNTRIVFTDCPYGPLCNKTLAALLARGDFNKATVPCLRMETYSACATKLCKTRQPYTMIQFAPGARCEGQLNASRVAKKED
ncbi:MAG: hypothetical protein RBU37_24630 [Myxococcota bacterium]|jgi:hypothetical protein|nr:hypothetical protein [Myxococcota bacterium]